MIKHKSIFCSSIFLLISALIMNAVLTNYNYFQGYTGTILSIPIWNTGGYFAIGLYLLFAGVIGLVLLPISLKEKKVRLTLIAIIIFIIIPPILK
ncbi:hypothetical protein J14TS2_11360 [Bacillus sp. J14TS2]|uniref:hypothetical protein n=1 Tax=Bacillus sp. J14TS2 TaxID=2807188 RepID=UPI001B2CD2E2|nr:hypothetical protein [Bacillus sp. J14TS2]GIN70661.1 hypothetical protein J14TS2_11360 [Bacillus sp. J14TS2]